MRDFVKGAVAIGLFVGAVFVVGLGTPANQVSAAYIDLGAGASNSGGSFSAVE